jgi:hypothetical protein
VIGGDSPRALEGNAPMPHPHGAEVIKDSR